MVMGHRYFLFIFCGLTVLALSVGIADVQARSKKIQTLTKSNITAFIEDTSAITSSENIDRDDAEVSAYLTRHIDDQARFTTSISYAVPGMPVQKKSLSLKKADYIQQVKKGADSVEHYHSEITVNNVKISKNKKKASVNTTAMESGIMQMPDKSGNIKEVPIEGKSKCFQVLKLSKAGYIQMYSASCTTTMRFLEN